MRKQTVLLGISFLISKILGFFREALLAAQFGAGQNDNLFNLDVYVAAFRIPDFVFNLLSYGVLSAAFVPLFVERLKKNGDKSAFTFTNEILNSFCIGMLVVLSVVFFFAPAIVRLIVPGFEPEAFDLTVKLTRLMLISPFFFTIGTIAGGVANSFHRFLGIALAPMMYNIGILLGVIFLAPQYGVYGVALGVIAGAFLNTLVQLPSMFRAGFRYQLPRTLWNKDIREMVMLSLPRIFGMSVAQISLIIETMIASTLPLGSVAIMSFATNIQYIPIGLIGISSAIVSFGTLAAYSAEGNIEGFAHEIRQTLHRMLRYLMPITAGMIILRYEIVSLLLERGKFTAEDTALTAETVQILLLGLIFGSVIFLLARGFYALKDTRTPVIVGVAAVAANGIASIALTKIWNFGTLGLAAGNALAALVNAVALFVLLNKKVRRGLLEMRTLGKYLVSTATMTAALLAVRYFFALDIGTLPLPAALGILGSQIILGIVVYFGTESLMTSCGIVGA